MQGRVPGQKIPGRRPAAVLRGMRRRPAGTRPGGTGPPAPFLRAAPDAPPVYGIHLAELGIIVAEDGAVKRRSRSGTPSGPTRG